MPCCGEAHCLWLVCDYVCEGSSVVDARGQAIMKLLSLALIVGLTLAVVWLTSVVVRLENYRYANFLGMCGQYNINNPVQRIVREDCLEKTQTRTYWFWHLFYGLKAGPIKW